MWKKIASYLALVVGLVLLATPPHYFAFGLMLILIAVAIWIIELKEQVDADIKELSAGVELVRTKKRLRNLIDKFLPPEDNKE